MAAVGDQVQRSLQIACLWAARRRRRAIWTDAVMFGLATVEREIRGVFEMPPSLATKRQKTPPPMRLTEEMEREAAGTLNLARRRMFGNKDGPEFEDDVCRALLYALADAQAEGLAWVGGIHLYRGLLADPGNEAGSLLRQLAVDLDILDEAARRLSPGAPPRNLIQAMQDTGVLSAPGQKEHSLSRLLLRPLKVGPALFLVESGATDEAVWLGHCQIAPVHLMLSVVSAEEQMLANGLFPVPTHAASTPLLAGFGVEHRQALAAAATLDRHRDIAPPQRWRPWWNQATPRWTVEAARIAERARGLAASDPYHGGTRHLVHAALSDADASACGLLRLLGADPAAVLAQTSQICPEA